MTTPVMQQRQNGPCLEFDSALTTGTGSIPYNPTMAEDQGNIDLALDDATAYRNRGLSYSDMGQYRRAIELAPDDATGYYNRGRSYGVIWS